MSITDVFKGALTGELRVARGRVVAFEPDGRVRVRYEPGGAREVACDVLRTGAEIYPFSLNDEVLVACAEEPGRSAVILGRIGPAGANQESPTSAPAPGVEPQHNPPREIVIEAGEELTLKCGEASIRITRDGRIVIRGEHILSRAKGTQRIKGGSVAIN